MTTLKEAAPWVIAAVAVAALIGIIIYYQAVTVHTTGRVYAVGISVNATSIDWGAIPPGGTSAVTLQLWNNGTVPVTVNVTTSNYAPTVAQQYLSLTTDLATTRVIAADQRVDVKLMLNVAAAVSGVTNFSFDITFTATESK
jgi:hypothetical protein